MNVLVINAGSSSLKYQLLNPETGVLLAKGLCERIGLDGRFTYKPQLPGRAIRDAEKLAMPTHAEAISEVLRALADPENGVVSSMDEIGAVGHRVVHGGESFAESVLIDEDVLRGQNRGRDVVNGRQIAMYLIRRMTNLSLSDIGKEFGGRDHTTVLHSLDKVEKQMRSDPAFAEVVKEITTNINAKR